MRTTFNLTPAQEAIRYNPEVFAPNAEFWHILAKQRIRKLIELIGNDNARIWMEMTWPGDLIFELTYQELAQGFESALELGKDVLFQMLECTCKPDSVMCCAPCRAAARIRARSADETE